MSLSDQATPQSRRMQVEAVCSIHNSRVILIISGYPVGNVPLGYLDFNGRPFGLAVLAAKDQEAKILKFMNAWEGTFGPRQVPPLLQ